MRWSPRVTVAAVITDPEGRHLLVEERPRGEQVYNQPAGHLEAGESLLDAVIREVREETCRAFEPRGLVGVYRWRVPPRGDTYLRFCFIGEAGPELADSVRDPDIIGTRWATPDEIDSGALPLRSPMVRQCMRDALARPAAPLILLQDLVNHDD
jgi:ADP-ribose pyrophosphatase YjhB (NUDIX family)